MSLLQRPRAQRGGGNLLVAFIALVTTLCCLGFPTLVGLLATLGAGFLVSDRYLEPLLVATLLLTLVIAALHMRRHHQPGSFILSAVAVGSVFFAVYGVGLLPHASGGDHMAATSTWSPSLAYGAMLVLLVAQIWDLLLFRRCTRSPLLSAETRKEGV
ncbi:MAG: Hg(2+) transporter MerH [Ktedonobacteraceae bacterium]